MRNLCAALLALFFVVGTLKAEEGWLTDYDQAVKLAKEKDRDILMDFTGSDWCGWCIKLKKEVFDTPEFKEYAAKNLVLLEVDFPNSVPQSEAQKAANEKLAKKYGIQGFPTIILLNKKEKQIGKLQYMPGGPKPFIAAIEKAK